MPRISARIAKLMLDAVEGRNDPVYIIHCWSVKCTSWIEIPSHLVWRILKEQDHPLKLCPPAPERAEGRYRCPMPDCSATLGIFEKRFFAVHQEPNTLKRGLMRIALVRILRDIHAKTVDKAPAR